MEELYMKKEPVIVKSHDIHLDSEYTQWIHEIKERYRNTQIKAAVKVNSEQLLFNWLLGKDLVTRKAEEKWGAGIVEQVSLDMQNEFPHAKGFSTTNLWNMKKWFLFYSGNYEKLQQLVGEMDTAEINSNSQRFLHLFHGDIIYKSLQNANLPKKQHFTLKRLRRKAGAAAP